MPLEIVVKPSPELKGTLDRMEKFNQARSEDADVIRRLEARVEEQVKTIQAEHEQARNWERAMLDRARERDELRTQRDNLLENNSSLVDSLEKLQRKLDTWNADQKKNRDAALEQAIKFRKAAEHARDDAREQRDWWNKRSTDLEAHIKRETILLGINPTHLSPWQQVAALAEQHEAREDASSWEGSYAKLKADIHQYATALGIPAKGTCRNLVRDIARKAEEWAEKASHTTRLEEQLGEEQQDRVDLVGELQQVKGTNVRLNHEQQDLKQQLELVRTSRRYFDTEAGKWRGKYDELQTYFEGGIKDDAERAGMDTRGLVGMAQVHEMAAEIEKCHRVRSVYWDGVQETIRSMECGLAYHKAVEKLRKVQEIVSKAYGAPPPPDQSAELQRRCDLLETGIRKALDHLSRCPKKCDAWPALRKALEHTGLDGCEPPEVPNELKEKLEELQGLLEKGCYASARSTLKEALAMTDFLYHQNDPPMTDRAYQALEKALKKLQGSHPDLYMAREAIKQARKLLVTEPSAAMVRGALKQARDLLASAEKVWNTPTGSVRELGKVMTRQHVAVREALILLDTVLED